MKKFSSLLALSLVAISLTATGVNAETAPASAGKQYSAAYLYGTGMHSVGRIALPQHQMQGAESFTKFVDSLVDSKWNTICYLIDKTSGEITTTLVLKQANGAGIMTVRDIKFSDGSLQLVNSEIGHPVSFTFEEDRLSIVAGREKHTVATTNEIKESASGLFGKDVVSTTATPKKRIMILPTEATPKKRIVVPAIPATAQ